MSSHHAQNVIFSNSLFHRFEGHIDEYIFYPSSTLCSDAPNANMSNFDKFMEDLTNQESPKINGIAARGVNKTGILFPLQAKCKMPTFYTREHILPKRIWSHHSRSPIPTNQDIPLLQTRILHEINHRYSRSSVCRPKPYHSR